MSTVRDAIEKFLVSDPAAAGPHALSCETLRVIAEQAVGYHVSGTTVSRILGNLGWERIIYKGKVHFRRTARAVDHPTLQQ